MSPAGGLRVLVTGASGFLGRYVVRELVDAQHSVVATSRRRKSNEAVHWIECDLLDERQCRAAVKEARADVIVHLAWYAEHGKFWTAAQNLDWTRSTLVLLDAFAQNGGKRAVMAGSCAEYDWDFGYCIEEMTPTRPASLYGVCKDATRRVTEAFARAARIEWAWGRIFFPFGLGEPAERLVPSVVRALLEGRSVRCSHGRQIRDFIHVEDAARAIGHLAGGTRATGVFNIATGEPTRISAIVNYCVDAISPGAVPEFGAIPVTKDDPPMLVGDSRRLRSAGWEPRLSWQAGLSQVIEQMRQQRMELDRKVLD